MATSELGTAKTVVVLAIVVGCFAVLWPKIFYPMLQASINPSAEQDDVEECCEVLFSKDVEAMGVVRGVCEEALRRHEELMDTGLKPASQQLLTVAQKVIRVCREEVMATCGVDISVLLVGSLQGHRVAISKKYMESLQEIRSFNATTCLRKHFGLDPSQIGGPRRMRTRVETPQHMRPERPPHLRPDMMHPALREKGRAIPQRTLDKEARPGPMPGMRPPIGGPGHVVPAPKGSGTMGIVMPLYTVGIVIFFVYTIMKVLFKKHDDHKEGEFPLDTEQRKYTYTEDYHEEQKRGEIHFNHEAKNGIDGEVTRKPTDTHGRPLVVAAVKGLIQAVDQERDRISEELTKDPEKEASAKNIPDGGLLSSTRSSKLRLSTEDEVGDTSDTSELHTAHDELRKMGGSAEWVDDIEDEEVIDIAVAEEEEEPVKARKDKSSVSVVGFEMSASLDGGRRWTPSPPNSPTPPPVLVRPHTPSFTTRESPVQSIILEGALPTATRLIVSDACSIEEIPQDQLDMDQSEYESAPVVLSGKVTLSVLGMELMCHSDELTTASSFTSATEDATKGDSARYRVRSLRGEHGTNEAEPQKPSSKASSPDMEEYEVIGYGSPQGAGSPVSVKSDSFEHMNGRGETSEKTQYVTATAAVPDEGTTGAATGNLTGAEETAADVSVMDALGDIDEQQEDDSRAVAEELPADTASGTDVRQRIFESEEEEEAIEEEEEEEEQGEEEELGASGPRVQPLMSTSSSLESAKFEMIPDAPLSSSKQDEQKEE